MWDVLAGNGRHLLSIAVSQVAFNQSDQQTTTCEDSWWIKLKLFSTEETFIFVWTLCGSINLILKQGWTLISSEAFMVVFKGLSSHMKHTCRCHEVLPQAHLQRHNLWLLNHNFLSLCNFTESVSVNVTCMQCFSTYTYIKHFEGTEDEAHTVSILIPTFISSIQTVPYIHAPCAAQLRAHAGFTHRRNMDHGPQRVWDHYHQQWLSWLGFLDLCACLCTEIYSSKTSEPELARTNAPNKSL